MILRISPARIWYSRESPTWPTTAEPFSSTARVSTHAMPSQSGLIGGGAKNFVVGQRNGFADALLGGAGLALQARAHAFHGDLRGLLAGGVTADAVDHQEDAAVGVDVPGVFVVPAHPAHVAGAGEFEAGLNHWRRCGNPGRRTPASPMRAWGGTGASTSRSRFSPSTNSMLEGAFSPLIVVPRRLRSLRKNCPVFGSRRRRKCSRETSGRVSSLRSVQ